MSRRASRPRIPPPAHRRQFGEEYAHGHALALRTSRARAPRTREARIPPPSFFTVAVDGGPRQ